MLDPSRLSPRLSPGFGRDDKRRTLNGMGRACYTDPMATAKKGQLVAATEWWKHLRRTKRAFWKRQRQADKREAADQRRDA
ncbi:hypothetical protein [uncultured Brevundimonas sp.]|uniref:hypothetical protein n=1 Tax=uncultured Brevundimonas sp. TaxID=213418 RepID=UPI0026162ABF|nr:hypothetical protein [uncultured Brevundimonas sp.]